MDDRAGKVAVEHIQPPIFGVLTQEDSMKLAIEKFWKRENVDRKIQKLAPFNQHITRDNKGRFVVQLSFRAAAPLSKEYAIFMKDYEKMWYRKKINIDIHKYFI